MSEQIELAGHEGDVVLVNGICYAFTEYTAPTVIDCFDLSDNFSACSTPLAQAYTVTLGGLTGIWEAWNGVHTVTWEDVCQWWNSEHNIVLAPASFAPGPQYWKVRCDAVAGTVDTLDWINGPDLTLCSPVYSYGTHTSCTSDDPADCEAQGETTCVVTALGVTASFNTCEECQS